MHSHYRTQNCWEQTQQPSQKRVTENANATVKKGTRLYSAGSSSRRLALYFQHFDKCLWSRVNNGARKVCRIIPTAVAANTVPVRPREKLYLVRSSQSPEEPRHHDLYQHKPQIQRITPYSFPSNLQSIFDDEVRRFAVFKASGNKITSLLSCLQSDANERIGMWAQNSFKHIRQYLTSWHFDFPTVQGHEMCMY